jgi:hypothetical protein
MLIERSMPLPSFIQDYDQLYSIQFTHQDRQLFILVATYLPHHYTIEKMIFIP